MLYATTRNNRDTFTAQRVLRESRGEDGGLYLPFREPRFSEAELSALLEKPLNQTVAEILNLLFQTKLTAWDIDFCSGRCPVAITELRHRILIGECWHNPAKAYSRMVNNLSAYMCMERDYPGNWVVIAVRIALLFGLFGEMKRAEIDCADVCVVSGDFSAPISAWYARSWGLPIGNIVCCCNENHNLWDLLSHGQMRTDSLSIPTIVPEADVTVPVDLERLIYACGGTEETKRYLDACRAGKSYIVSEPMLTKLRNGLHVSVVSSQRIESAIPSVYATHQYLLSPSTALAYSGLQDYRAKTGSTRHALILSDRSPVHESGYIAQTLGIDVEELKNML